MKKAWLAIGFLGACGIGLAYARAMDELSHFTLIDWIG